MHQIARKLRTLAVLLWFTAAVFLFFVIDIIKGILIHHPDTSGFSSVVFVAMVCLPWFVGIRYIIRLLQQSGRSTSKLPFWIRRRFQLGLFAPWLLLILFAYPVGMIRMLFPVFRPVYVRLFPESEVKSCRTGKPQPLPSSWKIEETSFRALPLPLRLRWWLALARERPREIDAIIQAGEEGERKAIQALRRVKSLAGAQLYTGKRVPRIKEHPLLKSRRSEIDVILLTHKAIHVIEVKNWSGRILSTADENLWQRMNRQGESRSVESPIALNRAKAWSLRNYLSSKGINIEERHIRTHVFLVNPNADISRSLLQHPDIVTANGLPGFSRRLAFGRVERLLLGMVRLVLEQEHANTVAAGYGALPDQVEQRLKDALQTIPTWDHFQFFGGLSKTGDLLDMKLPGAQCNLADLAAGQCIHFSWKRHRALALARALLGFSLGGIRDGKKCIACPPDAAILVHFAGVAQPERVPIASLEAIQKG